MDLEAAHLELSSAFAKHLGHADAFEDEVRRALEKGAETMGRLSSSIDTLNRALERFGDLTLPVIRDAQIEKPPATNGTTPTLTEEQRDALQLGRDIKGIGRLLHRYPWLKPVLWGILLLAIGAAGREAIFRVFPGAKAVMGPPAPVAEAPAHVSTRGPR